MAEPIFVLESTGSGWSVKMRVVVIGSVMLLSAVASARDNGQWSQSDPATREWFRSQRNPTTKVPCCSEADGTYAEEDIRGDDYWAGSPISDGICPAKNTLPKSASGCVFRMRP